MKINECDFITPSSGNVFKDLEFENPEEMLLKSDLIDKIDEIIEKKGLTKKAASKLLGLKQTEIAAITNGKFPDYSLNQLICFLALLGHEVTIKVTPKKVPKIKVRKPIALPKKAKQVIPLTRQVGTTTVRIQARKK